MSRHWRCGRRRRRLSQRRCQGRRSQVRCSGKRASVVAKIIVLIGKLLERLSISSQRNMNWAVHRADNERRVDGCDRVRHPPGW